jgi:hypothetical protein
MSNAYMNEVTLLFLLKSAPSYKKLINPNCGNIIIS